MIVVMTPGWERRVQHEAAPIVYHSVQRLKYEVRKNLIRHVRTGELLRSVHTVPSTTGGAVHVGTDHWQFPEYGTPPHRIRARYKKALYWAGARHPVRQVWHPGMREYAPLRRALATVKIFG